MKDRKYSRNPWRLVKAHRNYFIWGIILSIPLSVGLIFNSANTILVITALIVFFYAYETYKMRRAITDNTEINIRPVLVLYFKTNNIWIENFGNFPAYNLRFEETKLTFSAFSFPKSEEIALAFAKVTIVPSKERVCLLCIIADPCANEPNQPQAVFFGDSDYVKKMKGGIYWVTTTLIYDDILGRSWKSDLTYHSLTGIGAGRPELIDREFNTTAQNCLQ